MKTIPRFRLVAEPVGVEAASLPRFRFAGTEVGTRHQLGGLPEDPPNDPYWPRCSDCGDKMTFYGQLDSINDEFCIADVGVIQVYVCLDCNDVKALIASS